jgi:hypothetical protein
MAKIPETCEICGLPEGDTSDGLDPLGPMETCPLCGRRACPVCLSEADCCFLEADDHEDDPTWAPPGWRRASPSSHNLPDEAIVWERVSD